MPGTRLIPNTTFSVDAFRFPSDQITAYFLTHAHSGVQYGVGKAPQSDMSSMSDSNRGVYKILLVEVLADIIEV